MSFSEEIQKSAWKTATGAPENITGSLGVDNVLEQVSENDEEEWEYEYSTTETETYYLTIELSYPEFKERPSKAPHHSRGGYYKNLLDHDQDVIPEVTRFALDQDDEEDNDEEIEEGGSDEDDDESGSEQAFDPNIDPLLRPTKPRKSRRSSKPIKNRPDKGKGKAKGADNVEEGYNVDEGPIRPMNEDDPKRPLDQIQIMALHSKSPFISYRGRLFKGQWAEVIGTEAIFANHEGDNPQPLPALRHLPGDVDFLGACAPRILTTEVTPIPKIPKVDKLAAIKKEWNIRIPPGKDRTGERKEQISFLENLMAFKKQRGDKDEVTVYALDGEGKNFSDKRGPDFKPRKRKPPKIERSDAEDEDEDEEGDGDDEATHTTKYEPRRANARRSRRGGAGRRGRGKGRSGGRSAGLGGLERLAPGSTTLSTPTPSRWEDMSMRADEDEDVSLDDPEIISSDDDEPEDEDITMKD